MVSNCYLSLTKNLSDLGVSKEKRDKVINSIDKYIQNKELKDTDLKKVISEEITTTLKDQAIANKHTQIVMKTFANKIESEKMVKALQKDPMALIRSFVEGSTFSGVKDGEISYMSSFSHFESKYRSSFRKDLGELEKLFDSLDDEGTLKVYEAMNALKIKGKSLDNFTPETIKMAKAVNNHFDLHRKTMQSMGVSMGDQTTNWFGPQIHDSYEIIKADFEKWRDFIKVRLDKEKTVAGSSSDESLLDDYLFDVFNRIRNGDRSMMDGTRSLFFADAKSKFEYDQEFGYQNLTDMMAQNIRKGSKNAGLHYMLGPNPKKTFEMIVEKSLELMPENQKIGFRHSDDFNAHKNVLFGNPKNSVLTDGETHFANFTEGYLKWQRMTKLQTSVLNTLVDVTNIAGFYKSYFGEAGGGFFKGLGKFFDSISQVPLRGEAARELDTLLGVMQADHFERFDPLSGPDVRVKDKLLKKASKAVDQITKLNGLMWQERFAKRASVYMLANDIAEMTLKNLTLDKLPPRTQNFLASHGIGSDELSLIGKYGIMNHKGRNFISMEKLDTIDINDPTLIKIANDNGITISQAKDYISRKYGIMVNSWANRTVVSGGMSSSIKMNSFLGNPQKNSIRSSLAALVMQFKGYPLAATETIKRIALSNPDMDVTRFRDLLNKENAKHLRFLGDYVGTGIAISVATLWAKDLISNKTPRKIDAKMLAEATAMSIAPISFGYAMDVISGEFKSSAMLGPWARDIDDVAQLTHSWLTGDETKVGKTFNKLWQQMPLRRTVPFSFFIDDLYKNAVIDNVDPIYSQRLERSRKSRMEKKGQEKLIEF